MAKKLKKRAGEGSKHIKAPQSPSSGSSQNLRPVFSLEYLGGNYCLSKCELAEKAAFAERLHKLSQLTWAEIQRAHRHGLGCETITRDSIKASPPPAVTDDVRFLAFRFNGMAPMVGYRDGRIFFVIWLDRDFSLYDH